MPSKGGYLLRVRNVGATDLVNLKCLGTFEPRLPHFGFGRPGEGGGWFKCPDEYSLEYGISLLRPDESEAIGRIRQKCEAEGPHRLVPAIRVSLGILGSNRRAESFILDVPNWPHREGPPREAWVLSCSAVTAGEV